MSNTGKIILFGALLVGGWYAYKIYTAVKNIKVSFSGIRGVKADKHGLTVKTALEFDNIAGKAGFTVEVVIGVTEKGDKYEYSVEIKA